MEKGRIIGLAFIMGAIGLTATIYTLLVGLGINLFNLPRTLMMTLLPYGIIFFLIIIACTCIGIYLIWAHSSPKSEWKKDVEPMKKRRKKLEIGGLILLILGLIVILTSIWYWNYTYPSLGVISAGIGLTIGIILTIISLIFLIVGLLRAP